MPLLEIENLRTGYNEYPVLEEIDIEVGNDEIVGVIGPNGAGKSTVFKAVMGYLQPWRGEIRFNGEIISGIQPSRLVREGVGYVPQREHVFPKMSVRENLRMGGFTVEEDEFDENLETVFDMFPDLEDRQSQDAHSLSGGEKKLLGMARALITDPKLVLFDEPSAGLMPKYVDQVFEKVHQIREESSISFLIIEQNVKRVLNNSDRAYVLRDGKVAMSARSNKLLHDDELKSTYLGGTQS